MGKTGSDAKRVWPLWLRALIALAIAAALAVPMLLWREQLVALFATREQVVAEIRAAGMWGPVLIMSMVVAQTIVAPIPGQVINFVAGYVYGPWLGLLYSWLGMVLGIGLAMVIGRYAGRPVVERLVDATTLAKVDRLVAGRGIAFFLVLFLLPGLPDDLLCFVVGMTPLPLRIMWPLAALARVPGLVAAVLLGAHAEAIPPAVWIGLSVAGLIALLLIWRFGERLQMSLMQRISGRAGR